ncbi:MAG: hypothetical protein QOG02_1156 [Gaiellales bacterium]|jgi:uncharacterized protein YjbI with pentapeptide repeats|nr:hypothetical protein [Gaiellales bacterium]MDX6545382.1 hypothetical protein [Gaiellales bacterium]
MKAERFPEAPNLPPSLAPKSVSGLTDGEEIVQGEIGGASWTGVQATGLRFDGVVVRDADLSGSTFIDCSFRDSVLENCNLANTTFRGGSFTRVAVDRGRLTGLNVVETELSDTTFRNCGAEMATFRHAALECVTLDGCVLRQCEFMAVRGDWVRFHDCDLTEASFRHAQLTSSEFRRCRMEDLEGIEGLRGTSMELEGMLALAPAFARTLGIGLLQD